MQNKPEFKTVLEHDKVHFPTKFKESANEFD